jgi:hypothetical protein
MTVAGQVATIFLQKQQGGNYGLRRIK